jgi:hypothetical protein
MEEVSKEEFKLLLEIRQLKQTLGIADHPDREVPDLKAERDRLRKIVKVCYGEEI